MSVIILKGTDRKIECTISQCETINKMKESNMDSKTPLNIGGTVIELGEVRYAIQDKDTDRQMVSEQKKDENDKYYSELSKQYDELIEKRCFMKPEEKSKNTSLFETLYLGVTGKKINDIQKEFIVKKQKEYFDENPRHPYANINYYSFLKDLPSNSGEVASMKYNIGSSALRLTERLIGEAFNTAYRLKLL